MILLVIGLGCGIADRIQKGVTESEANTAANSSSNKTLTDKAVDTAVGDKQTGIPECDDAIRIFADQMNNPDDNFVVKTGKKMAENTFREQLKQRLEENKADKKEVAKFCKDFKDSFEESLKESNTNTEP